MEPSVWVAMAAVVVSAILGFAQWRAGLQAARAAHQSALEAKESRQIAARQLEAATQANRDAVAPYLWADIRPREDAGFMMLIIGNSGPTVARNVRVTFEPELVSFTPVAERTYLTTVQARLETGLASVSPGRDFQWTLGDVIAFFPDGGAALVPAVTTRIEADGPYGPLPTLQYVIAFEDLKHQALRKTPTERVVETLQDGLKPLQAMARSLDRR